MTIKLLTYNESDGAIKLLQKKLRVIGMKKVVDSVARTGQGQPSKNVRATISKALRNN